MIMYACSVSNGKLILLAQLCLSRNYRHPISISVVVGIWFCSYFKQLVPCHLGLTCSHPGRKKKKKATTKNLLAIIELACGLCLLASKVH